MGILQALIIFLAGFLCPDWAPSAVPEHPPRVVTQIQVEGFTPEGTQLQTYLLPEQMTGTLNWLRCMELRDPVGIDPDTFRSDCFQITLLLSDGTVARYRQLHREFIQKNDGPWRPLIPGDGLHFPAE